jgi:hypothetical protein
MYDVMRPLPYQDNGYMRAQIKETKEFKELGRLIDDGCLER